MVIEILKILGKVAIVIILVYGMASADPIGDVIKLASKVWRFSRRTFRTPS